jgi:tetratricopeptide (TPR) repeat protein
MASKRAIGLAETDPMWRDVFALQQSGHYPLALDLLGRIQTQDPPTQLLIKIYTVQLKFFMSASGPYDESLVDQLREATIVAKRFSYYDLLAECLVSAYDILVAHRQWTSDKLNDCVRDLVKLEPLMDTHTGRRWFRRKAGYLRKCGQLAEAARLLTDLIRAGGVQGREEADNSFCLVYYELGRLQSQMGRFVEAAQTFNHALSLAFAIPNRTALLLRLSNVLEKCGQSQIAEIRRSELYALWFTPVPQICYVCDKPLGVDGKLVLACCRDMVHSECLLKSITSNLAPGVAHFASRCPCCGDNTEVVDTMNTLKELVKGEHASDQPINQ